MVRSRRTTAPGGQGPGAAGAASARQSTLRTANLALVARRVLSSPEPVSRADVAAATGMTRSTASRLADDLVAAGILAELDPAPATGPGRPAVPLAPPRGTFMALGLEVNAAHMAVRAIDLSGQVLAEHVVVDDFADSDPAGVLARLARLAADVLDVDAVARARAVGAALALPGLVSGDRLLRAPNLGWRHVRPAEHLGAVLAPAGLELRLGNEANYGAITVGRERPAAPPSWPSFIYLSGENGIGAGIMREGRIVVGANGFAGEIGHIRSTPTARGAPAATGAAWSATRAAGSSWPPRACPTTPGRTSSWTPGGPATSGPGAPSRAPPAPWGRDWAPPSTCSTSPWSSSAGTWPPWRRCCAPSWRPSWSAAPWPRPGPRPGS